MSRIKNISLRRSRKVGFFISLSALSLALLFGYGMYIHSYWALAVPVIVGTLAALNLVFWIGWAITTIKISPPEADQYRGIGARLIAFVISLTALGLAGLFGYGIYLQTYLALAIPIALAVLSLLFMVFWIGWAIITQKSTLALHSSNGVEQTDNAAA